jgi:GT2 family glycosyltransferase
MPLVTIGIVTWNSAEDVETCVRAVRAQAHQPVEVLVADNASTDTTRDRLGALTSPEERILFDVNRGFAAAHNSLISRGHGTYYLALNPDVTLGPDYVARLVSVLEADAGIGSATGKLLRREPAGVIDSAGIVMLPSIRHLDRGAGEPDRGQYDHDEDVFGASGAAALYRRAMLDDVRVDGEWFDESFFAYREDADLAWRAQLLGWRCRFVAAATATHVRRVTPERRAALPADVNRWSVRNRFLLRIKNQTPAHAWRFALPSLVRDAQVVGFVLLREWSSLPAFADVLRLLPATLGKRRIIMARKRSSEAAVAHWFRARG